MALITFSDGQTVDSKRIMRATLFIGEESLLVELNDGEPLKVFGSGLHADVTMLNRIRDEEKLQFLVGEKPKTH